MTNTLQKRFVKTAMTAISILLLLLLGAINTVNLTTSLRRTSDTLRIVASNEIAPPPFAKPAETPQQTDKPGPKQNGASFGFGKNEADIFMSSNFFAVRFDRNGNVVFTDTERTSTVTEEQAVELTRQAIAGQKQEGRIGKYRYSCFENSESAEKTWVFLDVTNEVRSCLMLLTASLIAGSVCWLLMLLLTVLLSKKAIRPIAESMEKQKQFVTNAGHEIKTPLAIIQSNTEALELFNGETKWSRNIRTQVERLSALTQSLLALARMDEGERKELTQVDLSEIVRKTAEQFVDAAEQKDISVTTDIAHGVFCRAIQAEAEQLCSILLDNAVKYTDPNGRIELTLCKKDRRAVLTVQNDCSELPQIDPQKLFDRFYRSDQARTQQSGGCGIGLSIAQEIVQACGGSIRADYPAEKQIRFTVIF